MEQCKRGVIASWSTRNMFTYDECIKDSFSVRYNGSNFMIQAHTSYEHEILDILRDMGITKVHLFAETHSYRVWSALYDLMQITKETQERHHQQKQQLTIAAPAVVAASHHVAMRDLTTMDDAELYAHIMMNHDRPFACMGLADYTNQTLVNEQYRRLALRVHPNRSNTPVAAKVFAVLKAAYNATRQLNGQRQA